MEMKGNNKSLKNRRNRVWDFKLNITVNEYGCIYGEIQHCESGETKHFRSLIEMILLINGELDQFKFTQPINQIRSWTIQKIPSYFKGGKVL